MRETNFTLGPIQKSLYLLLLYQFTFAQNHLHYITLKAFAVALGDGTKCKTCFGCPRLVPEKTFLKIEVWFGVTSPPWFGKIPHFLSLFPRNLPFQDSCRTLKAKYKCNGLDWMYGYAIPLQHYSHRSIAPEDAHKQHGIKRSQKTRYSPHSLLPETVSGL